MNDLLPRLFLYRRQSLNINDDHVLSRHTESTVFHCDQQRLDALEEEAHLLSDDDWQEPRFMADFFQQVSFIRAQITLIWKSVELLESMVDLMNSLDLSESLPCDLKAAITEARNCVNFCRKRLLLLHDDNKVLSNSAFYRKSQELNIREVYLDVLMSNFTEAVTAYYATHEKLMYTTRKYMLDKLKDANTRSGYIPIQDDEFLRFIDGNEVSDELNHVLNENETMFATQEILAVRHADLKALVETTRDLSFLMRDVSSLVERRGTFIDSIQLNMEKAWEAVHPASKVLTEAAIRRHEMQRRVFICSIGIILIVICVLFPIIFLGK